jgi:hypothetical protein
VTHSGQQASPGLPLTHSADPWRHGWTRADSRHERLPISSDMRVRRSPKTSITGGKSQAQALPAFLNHSPSPLPALPTLDDVVGCGFEVPKPPALIGLMGVRMISVTEDPHVAHQL